MHQSTAASTWWCSSDPILVSQSDCWPFRGSYPGHFSQKNIFLACFPLNNRRNTTLNLFIIGLLFLFLWFCLSLLPFNTVTSSSPPPSRIYISTFQTGPSRPTLLMQHYLPTLAYQNFTLFPPTLCPLFLHSPYPLCFRQFTLSFCLLFLS